MIPQTRTDLFLAKITGEDVALPVPQTRFELYLANIAGESYELPAPNSRATLYLAKILGQDVALPVPQTRSELYLASIAGMSVQLPAAPTTREEWYLARWAEDAGYVTITGNPVTFSAVAAKLRQLKIAFAPVQDLHGYDSPWPAGGGANKYGGSKLKADLLAVSGSSAGSDSGGAYVSLPASSALNNVTLYDGFAENTQYTFIYKINVAGGTGANIRVYYTDNTYQTFSVPADGDTSYAAYTTTAGKTVSKLSLGYWYTTTVKVYYDSFGIFDGSVALSGFTPYENECPISGWTGVNVWQAGINLFDETWEEGKYWDIADGQKKAGASWKCSDYIPCIPNTTLYIFKETQLTGSMGYICFYDEAKNYIGYRTSASTNVQFNTPANAHYMTLYAALVLTDLKISINYPATDTEYHAYDPASQLIPVVFPDGETYYSGWVDLITGDGIADMAARDLGTLDWTYFSSSGIFRNLALKTPNDRLGMCTRYKTVSQVVWQAQPDMSIQSGTSDTVVKDSRYTDAAAFKAASSGVMFVYPLLTPIPFHVDPQQINSLAGTNNMWSDANGDLTVEYWKDGNVSDVEALSLLLGGRYSPAQGPEDVPDREALRIITGR